MNNKKYILGTFQMASVILAGVFLVACSDQNVSHNVAIKKLQPETSKGSELVRQSIEAYEALESYQSNARIRTVDWRRDKKYEEEADLSLKIMKPDRVLATWQHTPLRRPDFYPTLEPKAKMRRRAVPIGNGAIWREEPGIYSMSLGGIVLRESDSIEGALTHVISTPARSASYTMQLFFGFRKNPGTMFRFAKDLELIGTEEIYGEPCHVVTGRTSGERLVTFWISTNDLLLRQYAKGELRPAWLRLDDEPDHQSELPTEEEQALQARLNPDRLHSFVDGKCIQLHESRLISFAQETYTDVSSPTFEASDFTYDPNKR